MVVYHLLGKTGWSTVVVNGTRQIPNGNFHRDGARSISTTFSRKIGSKAIQAKRPGTSKNQQMERTFFHSEIPFRNFGLPFKKSHFPEKISVRGDKINLSIHVPPKYPDFLGKW